MTTADWTDPTTHDTVAWRVGADDSVRLVTFLPASAYDSVYRVSTLGEALDLVLRGELPPTDAIPGSEGASEDVDQRFLVLATSIVVGAIALWMWLRRTPTHD